MSKVQKIILSVYVVGITVMCLVPPYEWHSGTRIQSRGYHPIWESHYNSGTVSVQLLGIQILVASLVTGVLWLMASGSKQLSDSQLIAIGARVSVKMKRTVLAVLACFVLTFAYIMATNILFGWRFGGGGIGMGVFSMILWAVWNAVRGADSVIEPKTENSHSDEEADQTISRPASCNTAVAPAISAPSSREPVPHLRPPTLSAPVPIPTAESELSAFELLVREKETGFRHEALWLKCFSEAEGDQARAEAAYNRERAATLAAQASAKRSAEQRAREIEAAQKAAEERAVMAKDTARLMAWRAEVSRHMSKLEWMLAALPPQKADEAVHVQVGSCVEMETDKNTLQQALAEFQTAAKKLHGEIHPSEWEGGHLKEPLAAAVKGETVASLTSLTWFECLALVNQGETWKQLNTRVQDAINRLDGWLLLHASHAQTLAEADAAISTKQSAKIISALHDKLQGVRFADLNYKNLEGFIVAREGRSSMILLAVFCLPILSLIGYGIYRAETARMAKEQAFTEAARIASEKADAEAARMAKEKAFTEAFRMAKEKADAETARLAKEKADAEAARIAKKVQADAEAARMEIEKAETEAARMAKKKADSEAAIRDLIALAQSGNVEAQAELGHRYAVGSGVDRDYDEAAKWNLKAAMQGSSRAQSNLGVNYGNGRGVPKDSIEAYAWWVLAANAGNTNAASNLKKYENFLTSEQKQRARNRAAELAREIR